MAYRDWYKCNKCSHKWQTRKRKGSPPSCPSCNNKSITNTSAQKRRRKERKKKRKKKQRQRRRRKRKKKLKQLFNSIKNLDFFSSLVSADSTKLSLEFEDGLLGDLGQFFHARSNLTFLGFLKDLNFIFWSILVIFGVFVLVSGELSGLGEALAGFYLYLVYFGILAFYWAPIFQEKLSIRSKSLNILMYLFQWAPFFGNLGLIVLLISKGGKNVNPSDKPQKVELKRKKKSHKSDLKDNKPSTEENLHEEKDKVKIEDKQDSELDCSKNEISDDKSAQVGRSEKESIQEKNELLDRLEMKLKNKGYSEKPLEDIFEKLDVSRMDQAKIKTALHLTANNVGIRRILNKLSIEEYCEKDLDDLSKELEDERFFSKSKESVSFELESYNKADNEECLNLIKKYHKRGRAEARLLEKIGRRLTITGEDNACEVLEILNKSYTEIKNRKRNLNRDQIRKERDKLRVVAEDAKDNNLDKIAQQLEDILDIDIPKPTLQNTGNNSEEVDDSRNTESQEDQEKDEENLEQKSPDNNYVEKINNFHKQGGYRYRLLERIGRRLLNRGATPKEIYYTLSEFSEKNQFQKINEESLEKLATYSKTESPEEIEKRIGNLTR